MDLLYLYMLQILSPTIHALTIIFTVLLMFLNDQKSLILHSQIDQFLHLC